MEIGFVGPGAAVELILLQAVGPGCEQGEESLLRVEVGLLVLEDLVGVDGALLDCSLEKLAQVGEEVGVGSILSIGSRVRFE